VITLSWNRCQLPDPKRQQALWTLTIRARRIRAIFCKLKSYWQSSAGLQCMKYAIIQLDKVWHVTGYIRHRLLWSTSGRWSQQSSVRQPIGRVADFQGIRWRQNYCSFVTDRRATRRFVCGHVRRPSVQGLLPARSDLISVYLQSFFVF